MMNLKEYRISLKITIATASKATGIPLRTYIRYENDNTYGDKLKRKAMFEVLKKNFEISETTGLLTIEEIKQRCKAVFDQYPESIDYCYLFGSYAKGKAKPDSDVDLFISTSMTSIAFLALIDEVKDVLKKKVDLIKLVRNNGYIDLINEVLKDGIKIYG